MSKNRIVIDYGDYEGLVLLSAFNNETCEELIFDELMSLENYGFELVKRYDGISYYKTLTETIDGTNKEGFVIKFKSGFRAKSKFSEYLRLHSIITNVSNIDIWEALKNGDDMEVFFEHVPDEFDAWVRKEIENLKSKYDLIWECSVIAYNHLYHKFDGDFSNKRSVAEEIKQHNHDFVGILFNMVGEKSIDEIIWSQIRPTFQKPNF